MAKETQKAKIERLETEINKLEKEIENYKRQLNLSWDKISEHIEKADNAFANSPYKNQLEQEVHDLKQNLESCSKLLSNADKRNKEKDEIISELQDQIHKSKNENIKFGIKNNRGAGRKPKFSQDQVEEIIKLRKQGHTFASLSKKYNCSIGLIHKLINEHS